MILLSCAGDYHTDRASSRREYSYCLKPHSYMIAALMRLIGPELFSLRWFHLLHFA
jgi:hypothetical protein